MKDPATMLEELKAWCVWKHGRKTKIARMLGLSPLVSDWFRGKSTPTWATGLKIQSFLKKSEKARQEALDEKQ